MGSNDSSSIYATATDKTLKLILVWKCDTPVNVGLVVPTRREGSPTANELLYLTIPFEVDRICRWWVTNFVLVIHLVGFDVPDLAHMLGGDQDFNSKFPASDELCAPQLAPSSRRPSSGFSWIFRACVSIYAPPVVDTYTFVIWVPIFR